MNRRTVLVASIFLFSVLGSTIPQALAVKPQRRLIIGKVDVAWVTDNPPLDEPKPANGIITITAFDDSDRASVNVYFYIPRDDTRVTINLVSVSSVETSADETVIEGLWDVHVNGLLYRDDALGQFSTTGYIWWGLDIGALGPGANVKIKGSVTLYK